MNYVPLSALLVVAGCGCSLAKSVDAQTNAGVFSPAKNGAASRWEDRGEDVGVVTSATALFAAPDPSSARIEPLKQEDQVVLVPVTPVSGFVNCVDLATGHEGWARSARLNIHYTKHRNPEITSFSNENSGGENPPSLIIYNNAAAPLYLHISGMPETTVAASSSKKISLQAGIYSFDGASPHVLPTFGHYQFLEGDQCTWTYTIVKDAAQRHTQKAVDPALVQESLQIQQQLDTSDPGMKIQQQKIADDEATLNATESKWSADSAAVQAARGSVDTTRQIDVDKFNAMVASTNTELATMRSLQQAYNTEINNYNAENDKLNAERERLRQIQQTINH